MRAPARVAELEAALAKSSGGPTHQSAMENAARSCAATLRGISSAWSGRPLGPVTRREFVEIQKWREFLRIPG